MASRIQRAGRRASAERLEPRCVLAGACLAQPLPADGLDDPAADEIGQITVPMPEPRAAGEELLTNGDFEQGTPRWGGMGGSQLVAQTDQVRTGAQAVLLTNRTAFWNGVQQDIRPTVEPGVLYRLSFWVCVDNAETAPFKLTVHRRDDRGDDWTIVDTATGTNDGWTKLEGPYRLDLQGNLQALEVYVEGPDPGVNFYVDDASMMEESTGDWREAADQRIEQIRKRGVSIQVLGDDGQPLPGYSVAVEQTSQAFGFGTAISSHAFNNPRYRDFLAENFEWGVIENAVKWPQYEPRQDDFQTALPDAMVAFAKANGMQLRGHNIFWDVEEFVPDWVKQLDDAALRQEIDDRIESVVGRFAGEFAHWDVNNEMLHGDYFPGRLGDDIRAHMFAKAREVDPEVELFVNDYQVVTGNRTDDYQEQIQGLLDAGAPVGGIGVQGHFSEILPDLVLDRLDRLGEFGIPIWMTEFDVEEPDENLRAAKLDMAYRLVFSHPEVEGAMMWGFWAGAHWRGENAALVDQDWTVNAAGRKYQALMDEWTTETSGETSGDGAFGFRGFHGGYRVIVAAPDGVERTFEIDVPTDANPLEVSVQFLRENDAPTISEVADVWTPRGTPSEAVAITLADDQTPVEELELFIVSSNQNLLTNAGVSITGDGAERTLTFRPTPLATGFSRVTLTVRDDLGAETSSEFFVNVTTPSRGDNLLPNPGFEQGLEHWEANGNPTLEIVESPRTEGAFAARATNRQNSWDGIAHSLLEIAAPGDTVTITSYVRTASDGQPLGMTVRQEDDDGVTYRGLQWTTSTAGEWTQLSGTFTVRPTGELRDLYVYVEGPAAGEVLFADAFSASLRNGAFEGDVTGDGRVDLSDFSRLKAGFGMSNSLRRDGDLDGDGDVDLDDFSQLKHFFGTDYND